LGRIVGWRRLFGVCRSRCDPPFLLLVCGATATPAISRLSLHDALPISDALRAATERGCRFVLFSPQRGDLPEPTRCEWLPTRPRSEEHTSELQSREKLVCRLLLEKKKDERKDSPASDHAPLATAEMPLV